MEIIFNEIDLLRDLVNEDILLDKEHGIREEFLVEEPNHKMFMTELDYVELLCTYENVTGKAMHKALSIINEFKLALNNDKSTYLCESIIEFINIKFGLTII